MNSLQMLAMFSAKELESFGISNALLVSLIGIIVVLSELAILAGLIILISKVINKFVVKKDSEAPAQAPSTATENSVPEERGVKLKDVDEKTAAMIMALVSEESKIPLDRLDFKSIKKVD